MLIKLGLFFLMVVSAMRSPTEHDKNPTRFDTIVVWTLTTLLVLLVAVIAAMVAIVR